MREVIFKNLSTNGAKKREVCVQEVISENGCTSKTVKRSLFFIQSVHTVDSQAELGAWMKDKELNNDGKDRNFHIMKVHSDLNKSDLVMCKAKGIFYLIVGKSVYSIVYLHTLRMEIKGPKLEKVG